MFWVLLHLFRSVLGPLHIIPVDWAGPVSGTNFALGSYGKFQPGFRDEKRPKILGTSSGAKYEKQSKNRQKSYNFRAYHSFGVKWDAYDLQNTAGKARRCHPGRLNSSR